jgi:hypothetical protein
MEKYACAARVYGTTTKQLIGPMPLVLDAWRTNRMRRKMRWLQKAVRFFWYFKHSRDGRVRVRILGIPLRFKAAGRYADHMA